MVLGRATCKLEVTKFTTTRTWGKPPPSPLYYILWLAMGLASKWHFVLRFPSGNLKIPTTRTPTTLGTHNFECRPPIEMKYKKKLWSLSRAFQQYVACHLSMSKSGDSWLLVIGSQIGDLIPNPSLGHNLCFRCLNGPWKPILDIYVPRTFSMV